jgi:preprotein translocase subunit SecF
LKPAAADHRPLYDSRSPGPGERAAKSAARAAADHLFQDVDPTLGKDSIQSGIRASIYAVIFVSLFMLALLLDRRYCANVALFTNIIILLGVMCSAGTTFTLPGIAGGC